MLWLIGHFFAICIGVTLGLLGGGGSVLALPVLVYVMGIAPKTAIPMTLVIVGSISVLGIIPHLRRGNINFRAALIFGSATTVGAFFGAKIAGFISGSVQMLLFAVMMLLAAGFMLYRTSKSEAVASNNNTEIQNYPKPACKYCWLWLLTEGVGVGIMTGLVGVGGGFAIVPALVLLGDIPMKQAIATSLLIIAVNSLAGLMGYLSQVAIDWQLTVSFTFAAGIGTVAGVYLGQFVPAKHLQKGFAYFLLAVAGFVLLQNRQSFQSRNYENQPIYSQITTKIPKSY